MPAVAEEVPGLPDMKVSIRQLFGIDSELEVAAYSEPDEHVPDIDPDYRFDKPTTLAILAGFAKNRRVMIAGYRLARQVAAQPALQPWIKRELAPGPGVQTDDELRDFAHKTHNTVYHPACTCRMGAPTDPAAALDAQLRLKGVQNVRVADGSVMPHLTTVNPCITTMLIGEKCADLIRGSTFAWRA